MVSSFLHDVCDWVAEVTPGSILETVLKPLFDLAIQLLMQFGL